MIGMLMLLVAFFKSTPWIAENVFPWVSFSNAITVLVIVPICLILAIFKKTRGFGSVGLFLCSYVVGITLWIWSLILSYTMAGIVWMIMGLLFGGIGIVPIALIASLLRMEWLIAIEIIVLAIIAFALRSFGIFLTGKASQAIEEKATQGRSSFPLAEDVEDGVEEDQSDKTISDFVDLTRNEMVKRGIMTKEKAERLITPDMLQELASLPQTDVYIVGEYGKVLTETPGPLRPLSKLPYPKETIKQAIEKLLARSQDPEYRNHLETALFSLDDFIPDDEVPLDKEENTRKWLKVRLGIERQRGTQQEMPTEEKWAE